NFILELLRSQSNLDFEEVATIFKLRKNWELDALENRLNAMIRQGALYIDQKDHLQIINPDKTYIGTVSGHAEGYGYLDVPGESSLFIPPHEMKHVLHGDT